MPRPRPPHLQRHKTRHGKYVWYVQRGAGPLVRIKAEYGTPEFEAAYNAALSDRPPTPRAHANTLGWLWLMYRQSGAWTRLGDGTKKQRENLMKPVLDKVKDEPLSAFTKQAIVKAMDARAATPFHAHNLLKTLRQMFKWAASPGREYVALDPTQGLKLDLPKTKGFPEWTYEEIIAYEKRWPLGTRQRVMLDVYVYTGLRRSDAVRLGPKHVWNNEIVLTTEKTSTPVTLPLLDVLKRTLAAGPTGETFIVTSKGKPYTHGSLGNEFKDACVAAGVTGKSAHGLRKAAAQRAAENGATAHQLMAIFGWESIKQAEHYTRAADRRRLSREAMEKLEK
jgi:integrase